MHLSVVRKNPQEPAQTRGSRQKKANPEGLVFPLLVVQCGPGFKLALTTDEEGFGCLSPVCGCCPFRFVKYTLVFWGMNTFWRVIEGEGVKELPPPEVVTVNRRQACVVAYSDPLPIYYLDLMVHDGDRVFVVE